LFDDVDDCSTVSMMTAMTAMTTTTTTTILKYIFVSENLRNRGLIGAPIVWGLVADPLLGERSNH